LKSFQFLIVAFPLQMNRKGSTTVYKAPQYSENWHVDKWVVILSLRVSRRGLESAVRPFWMAHGLMSLHSISAQLVVSVSCLV